MGITKRAVTVIGLRVHRDKISHEESIHVNDCMCRPQTTLPVEKGIYCSGCGRKVYRTYTTTVLEDFVKVMEDEPGCDPFDIRPTIKGYELVGDWRSDKHVYIGCFVSSTEATYSAEGADPVRADVNGISDAVITKFYSAMIEQNLWDEKEFGVWTLMLLE